VYHGHKLYQREDSMHLDTNLRLVECSLNSMQQTRLLPVTVGFYGKSHAAANFVHEIRERTDKFDLDRDIDETCQIGLFCCSDNSEGRSFILV